MLSTDERRGLRAVTDFEAIDFFRDKGLVADPYPYFDALREQCPVRRERHHGRTEQPEGNSEEGPVPHHHGRPTLPASLH